MITKSFKYLHIQGPYFWQVHLAGRWELLVLHQDWQQWQLHWRGVGLLLRQLPCGHIMCDHWGPEDRRRLCLPQSIWGKDSKYNFCIITKTFKYIFKGVTYDKCILLGDGKPKCSTKTDNNGNHIEGEWGYCPDNCPVDTSCVTTEGPRIGAYCVFPFQINVRIANIIFATETLKKYLLGADLWQHC